MALSLVFVNSTGLPPEQVFITFQNPVGNAFDVSYGSGTPVAFANSGDLMSISVDLQTIGAAGLTVNELVGGIVFVSYGAALTATSSPPSFIGSTGPDYGTAFQPFELTMQGGTGDQGDMTAINYFTAPMTIASYTGGVDGTRLQQVSYVQSASDIAAALAKLTGSNPASVITNSEGVVVRYIGPSSYGPTDQNPFPSLRPYLRKIHTDGQNTTISNSNAFNAGSTNYDFTLQLTATVDADCTIVMRGSITTTVTPSGKTPTAGPTFDDATVTISAKDAKAQDFVLYGQAIDSNVVSFGPGWTELADYLQQEGIDSGALGITQSLAIGEITSGLLMGFVDSSVVPTGSTVPLKDMPSRQWWALDPVIAFSQVQTNPAYYDQYGNVLFVASNNEVYSIPFSDRMGTGPLVNSVSYQGQSVDTWVVTLLPPVSGSSSG